jgi:hypothetical protein
MIEWEHFYAPLLVVAIFVICFILSSLVNNGGSKAPCVKQST